MGEGVSVTLFHELLIASLCHVIILAVLHDPCMCYNNLNL